MTADIVDIQGRRAMLDRPAFMGGVGGGDRVLIVVSPSGVGALNRMDGFEAGDHAIQTIARVLTECAPKGAAITRLAGAKFALSAPASGPDAAMGVLGELFDDIAAKAPAVSTHLGGAWAPIAIGAEAMMSAALTALDAARGFGPQGLELTVVDPEAAADEMALAREALAAIRSDQASIALQPVVDAERSGRVIFREALIRLKRADGEVVPAGRFMPTLARFGAAAEVDIAVLNEALAALARDASLRVSVNISAAGLSRPGWRAAFIDAAERSPDLIERLIVEVSEDAALTDIGASVELFTQIRARGGTLALDDFGAGRTSFRHLRDFRFDMVKIDGSFITGIDRSPDNQALVAALVGLARQFDMMIVAEFVETAQEARALRRLGVDALQGFLFGRPTLVWADGEAVDRALA
ncbi:MAG: EAL domain-containing protein [Pseudomonadota bacterium]